MNDLKKIITSHPRITALLILLVLGALLLGVYLKNKPMEIDSSMMMDENGQIVPRAPLPESGVKFDYVFNCPDGKSFSTSYDLGSNALTVIISPEVSHVLPQDVSASGARYSSADGQVVYLEESGKSKVEINGEVMYENCVVAEPAPGV